jgi:hypothetical protein
MRSKLRTDSGVTAVLVAIMMLLIMGVAALAIDLGSLRFDIRADRLASDMAAVAGAGAIDPLTGSNGEEACQQAWDYAWLNLSDLGGPPPPIDCTPFAGTCNPSSPVTITETLAPYRIHITFPVVDTDPLMAGQGLHSLVDGRACQRFGVRIERDRDLTFARVLGFDVESTDVRSVARLGSGTGAGELVPLVVLEPYRCDALYTSGQGKVTVRWFQQSPGLIVVDSEASDCGPSNPYSIDSQGTQKGWIRAIPVPSHDIPSAILTYALSGAASANPARAYDPADLSDAVGPGDGVDPSDPVASWFRLFPRPTGIGSRVTRAPIDWRYNCKGTYPDHLGISIGGCATAGPGTAYIDLLVQDYGTIGTNPPGFIRRWTDHYLCSPPDPSVISVTGNWYVDCPGTSGNQGLHVGNGVSVTFADGNVVFDGQVRVFGSLTINPGGAEDHVVYLREGEFEKDAQATVSMEHTFVYLEDGRVDFNGGSGGLVWSAPDGLGFDPWGPLFDDLALWSESSEEHRIGGQAGNDLEGTFFTPNANPFVLSGQGSQFQTKAQFLTRRLELSGQAEVVMSPNPDRVTLIPIREIRLIR